MKHKIKDKLIDLLYAEQKRDQIKSEVSKMLEVYSEKNRKFSDGEIVIVFDEFGREMDKGVVAGVGTIIRLEGLFLKDYQREDFVFDALDRLRYEIYALKKDGNRSTKHLFQSPHFIGDTPNIGRLYIKKIDK